MKSVESLGIIFIMLLLLIGISIVSIHYRRRYEKLRDLLKRHFNIDADDIKI